MLRFARWLGEVVVGAGCWVQAGWLGSVWSLAGWLAAACLHTAPAPHRTAPLALAACLPPCLVVRRFAQGNPYEFQSPHQESVSLYTPFRCLHTANSQFKMVSYPLFMRAPCEGGRGENVDGVGGHGMALGSGGILLVRQRRGGAWDMGGRRSGPCGTAAYHPGRQDRRRQPDEGSPDREARHQCVGPLRGVEQGLTRRHLRW